MVSEAKVIEAIEEIIAKGKRPTVPRIAKRIGGSYRDIAPILKEWKRKRTETVPPEVSRMVKEYRSLDPMDREIYLRLTNLKPIPRSEMLRRLSLEDRKDCLAEIVKAASGEK
jgi:hypothetical protein